MRGKQRPWRVDAGASGLIPAHAGKTTTSAFARVRAAAHPRACGENRTPLAGVHGRAGSSPRMRGKLKSTRAKFQDLGLIPAHAGKTRRPLPARFDSGAHPRACGENKRHEKGSTQRPWLIPAHAGKTWSFFRAASRVRAHPRACGENLLWRGGTEVREGSSPRMRGKLCYRCIHSGRNRLIPAHAGKTHPVSAFFFQPGAHPRACGENRDNHVHIGAHPGSSPRMRGKH